MGFSHPDFTVIKELGRGASGVVYLAVQNQLNRRVALKMINDPLAVQATRQRFLREARILAQLSHPNILPVYELSELPDQQGFLMVMAYIDGGTLRQRRADFTLRQALLTVKQIADALGYAHDAGFVHRDVKPDNILFQGEQAMLADFGIARQTASQTQMTQHGAILGTPTYMSPEQVNGGAVDARSDLYCLGIVFYELLAGEPPYQADTAIATGIQHLTARVPTLPAVFHEYQPLIDKVLAKDKTARPASASEFVDELRVATRQIPWSPKQRLTDLRAKSLPASARTATKNRSSRSPAKKGLFSAVKLTAGVSVVLSAGFWFLLSTRETVDQPVQIETATINGPDIAAENNVVPARLEPPAPESSQSPEAGTTSGETEKPAARENVIEPTPPEIEPDPLMEKLADARQLQLDGKLFDGDINAVTQFRSILALDPKRKEAGQALDDILQRSLDTAEQRFNNGELDSATVTLQPLQNYWPEDSRVSTLVLKVEKAKADKREEARRLAARRAEQQAAKRAEQQARLQRIEQLLDKAVTAKHNNQLIEPEDDNAHYYYQAVLAEDPDHAIARSELTNVKEAVIQRIVESSDNDAIPDNAHKLNMLEKLYPGDSSIVIARTLLENRQQTAEQIKVEQSNLNTESPEDSKDAFRLPGF